MKTLWDRLNTPIYLTLDRKTVAVFLRQFSALLRAGIKPDEALDLLKNQRELKRMGQSLVRVHERVCHGATLAEAFSTDRKFDPFFIQMIATGEATGALRAITAQMALYYEREWKWREKIRGAIVYPIFLLCAMAVVLLFLFSFVLPTFATLFEGVGEVLPMPTRIVMRISELLLEYGAVMALTAAGLVLFFLLLKRLPVSGYFLDRLHRRLIFPTIQSAMAAQKVASALALLTAHAVMIHEAVALIARGMPNRYEKKKLGEIKTLIEHGESVHTAFEKSGLFPALMTTLVAVGEKTGDLPRAFEDTAHFYREELNAFMETRLKMLEPVLILIMAVLVGAVVLAVALPMFDYVNMPV